MTRTRQALVATALLTSTAQAFEPKPPGTTATRHCRLQVSSPVQPEQDSETQEIPKIPFFSEEIQHHHSAPEITAQETETWQSSLSKNSPDSYWIEPADLEAPVWTLESSKSNKVKYVNLFGLWTALVNLVVLPPWILAMTLLDWYGTNFDTKAWDQNNERRLYDTTGKVWSKAFLTLTNSYPTQSGQKLDSDTLGPCLLVANHASWLDIPVLCATALDKVVFKFIAKGDLTKFPGIGQQLTGGKHILIDREDRRSQLRTFKQGITCLKNGIPLMAFPEGKRSTQQGRLMEFKGGLFSMAIKTGVPVVPISLSHTHAIFPPYGLLPVQSGRGKLHVHVHEPIDSQGKTEQELSELVRQAFCDQLPECQLPMEVADDDDDMTAMAP